MDLTLAWGQSKNETNMYFIKNKLIKKKRNKKYLVCIYSVPTIQILLQFIKNKEKTKTKKKTIFHILN